LINLTGIAPRRWDNEQKYLAKVALPDTGATTSIASKDKKSSGETKVAVSHLDQDDTTAR
jgi:hypothetical protein